MGDRIAIFHGGYVQQIGTPQQVYDNPANKFVAGFIGSPAMNFVPAKLEYEKEQHVVVGRGNAFRFTLPKSEADLTAFRGRDVLLGIRPEQIEPSTTKKFEVKENRADAVVEIVELMGAEKFVHLKIGDSPCVARFDAHVDVEAGKKVECAVNLKLVHLFDPQSEKTIY